MHYPLARMSPAAAYATLFLGLLLVSTAGPFVRAAGLDAYALVFWRLAGSAPVFLAWALWRGELGRVRGHARQIAAGALLLCAHFLLWIKAFDLTDYSSNLLLLVSQPIVAAIVGARLGEKSTRSTWISVGFALAGLAVIARGDFDLGPRALLGDAISIVANAAITGFYVVTVRARREVPLPAFLGATTAVGALAALPIVLASGAHLSGYAPTSWAWLAALVLITTVAGHGTMNLVARHVRLFTLNVVIVLEPAIGIALGVPLFGATVTPLQAAGGVLLAVAVVVGLLPEWRARTAPAIETA